MDLWQARRVPRKNTLGLIAVVLAHVVLGALLLEAVDATRCRQPWGFPARELAPALIGPIWQFARTESPRKRSDHKAGSEMLAPLEPVVAVAAPPQFEVSPQRGSCVELPRWDVVPQSGACIPTRTAPSTDPMAGAEPVRVAARVDGEHCAKPAYPPGSLKAGEAGVTLMAFLISVDGHALESRVESSSGYAALDRAALADLQLCQFTPASVDGTPHASWARIEYTWNLE